jgi:hypothetical protein
MARKSVKKIQLSPESLPLISLFGLVSSEPAYKLSVTLNTLLSTSLKNASPVVVHYGTNIVSYNRFTDSENLPHSWISLIDNRSDNYCLTKKLPNIDFLIAHFSEYEKNSSDDFLFKLRAVKLITAVFQIENGVLESQMLELLIPHY